MTPSITPASPNEGSEAIQEHPEQLPGTYPGASQPSPYGPRNENLPEQLIDALKCALKEFAQQEMYVRRREVMADRLKRFYERGYQHVYETKTGQFTQGAPGQVVAVDGKDIQCPNYIDDYNIFQPYERVIQAILTQNPPGIDFRPINPNLSEDTEAAETAEGYRMMFDRSNKTKSIQTQIVRMFCLSGRTVLWTRTEANGQKFGLNPDSSPKKMETATVYGTLESRVPILSKSQDDCLYCVLYDDPDVKQAKAEYPEFRDKIKPNEQGLSENAYERTARMGVLQGARSQASIGDAFTHLCTREHAWMRPAVFEGEKYEDPFEEPEEGDIGEDGAPLSVRGKLCQLFPFGVHAVFVGSQYVGCWAESMDDAVIIGFPYEGDGMFRMAIMDPMVVVQDRFNDNMNAAAEVWDMGWPSTWINADDQEYEAVVNQKADPYAIRQKKARSGLKLTDDFFREPNPELPVTFMQFLELLEGPLAQFMLAAPPALFGAAMEDQKTASGYAQARSQAMGQQGLNWGAVQDMMARMYYQAALCAAANPDHSEEIVLPGEGEQVTTLRLDRLTKGKFGAYPDEDSAFPESTVQKRGTLERVLTMAETNPVIGQQIMSSPDNWKTFAVVYGFPELVIPEAIARDKQQFEIEELLKSSPIPPDPMMIEQAQIQHAAVAIQSEHAGMPAPPFDMQGLIQSLTEPSVPVLELDFHAWEFAKCQEWLSSGECRKQIAEGNQQGVDNVTLHAMQHKQHMMIEAAQAAMAAGVAGQTPGAPAPKEQDSGDGKAGGTGGASQEPAKKLPPPLSSPPPQSSGPPPVAATM